MPYVLGTLVLAALAIGLFVWKGRASSPPAPESTAVTATAPPTQAPPPQLHSLPPPPPIEEAEADAGADAGKASAPKAGSGSAGAAAPGGCSGQCQGSATSALSSALRGAAQLAQGCYNRALRTSEASGKMTVTVRVGPTGSVCSAQITSDTVGSGEISSCVLGRFRGKTYPPPSGGCLDVNIPISFVAK